MEQPLAREIPSTLEDSGPCRFGSVLYSSTEFRRYQLVGNGQLKDFEFLLPCIALQEIDGRPQLQLPTPPEAAKDAPYLHTHALWTSGPYCSFPRRWLQLQRAAAVPSPQSQRWEFLVQRSPGLRILCVEDVDLGSGPLEWLCKGLRSHKVGHVRLGFRV